ncbi:superinfection immunity protein [Gordonia rubripertincta]|uniref:superinfection immunity protein n=1 Tax=Gordonia rubripertincta TaxID=36822 RepID=UPI001C8F317E|nr:superinfection immunity protein [Gordonia rubripertincta]
MIGLYLLPSIVAEVRKVPNKGSVIVINLLLGLTIIGWVVALAMAARDVPPKPQPIQVAQPPQPPQQPTYRRPNPMRYRGN